MRVISRARWCISVSVRWLLCLAVRSSVARKDDLFPLLSLVLLGCVRVEGDEHNWCLALQERLGSLPLCSSRCVLLAMDKSLMFLPVRRWCLSNFIS